MTDTVEVTQADRDIAADLCLPRNRAAGMRAGLMDGDALVKAFARHRHTTEAASRRSGEALREALTNLIADCEHGGPKGSDLEDARAALSATPILEEAHGNLQEKLAGSDTALCATQLTETADDKYHDALSRIANLGSCARANTPQYKLFQEAIDIAMRAI